MRARTPESGSLRLILRFALAYAVLALLAIVASTPIHDTVAWWSRTILALLPGEPRITSLSWSEAAFVVRSPHPGFRFRIESLSLVFPVLVGPAAALAGDDGARLARRFLDAAAVLAVGLWLVGAFTALHALDVLTERAAEAGVIVYPPAVAGVAALGREWQWNAMFLLFPAVAAIFFLGRRFFPRAEEPAPSGSGRVALGSLLALVAVVAAAGVVADRKLARADGKALLAELERLSPDFGRYLLAEGKRHLESRRYEAAYEALRLASRHEPYATEAKRLMTETLESARVAAAPAHGEKE